MEDKVEVKAEAKKWFASKTLWVNALAIAAVYAQSQYGFVMSEEMQIMLLSLINLGLRVITKDELSWK